MENSKLIGFFNKLICMNYGSAAAIILEHMVRNNMEHDFYYYDENELRDELLYMPEQEYNRALSLLIYNECIVREDGKLFLSSKTSFLVPDEE